MGHHHLPTSRSYSSKKTVNNCDVQKKDVQLSQRVFGPDVPNLKGKSTMPQPQKFVDKEIEIPAEFLENIDKDLELAINIV